MRLLTHAIVPVLLVSLLVGCASAPAAAPTGTPDVAVAQLNGMAGQALLLAQKTLPGAVLRQIDSDAFQTVFIYTDPGATQQITVLVNSPGTPVDQWQAAAAPRLSLIDASEQPLDLKSVKISLSRAAQIVSLFWPGCLISTLSLYTQNNQPSWLGFCKTADGMMAGQVDAQTGNLRVITTATPIVMPNQAPAVK
jgi:hypothetical protein